MKQFFLQVTTEKLYLQTVNVNTFLFGFRGSSWFWYNATYWLQTPFNMCWIKLSFFWIVVYHLSPVDNEICTEMYEHLKAPWITASGSWKLNFLTIFVVMWKSSWTAPAWERWRGKSNSTDRTQWVSSIDLYRGCGILSRIHRFPGSILRP